MPPRSYQARLVRAGEPFGSYRTVTVSVAPGKRCEVTIPAQPETPEEQLALAVLVLASIGIAEVSDA